MAKVVPFTGTNMRVLGMLDRPAVVALTKALSIQVTAHCVNRPAGKGDASLEVLNAIAAVVGTVLACSPPGPEQDQLRATFEQFVAQNVGAASTFNAANPGAIEGALYG